MANAEEVMRAIYSALSDELVRSTLRTQLQSIPRPMLAKLLSVTPKRLDYFMGGGAPNDALWNGARAFEDGMPDPLEVEIEAVALNMLADLFPTWKRVRVRRALAEAIRPVLVAEGRTPETF